MNISGSESTKHILEVCTKMWKSEDSRQRKEAISIVEDMQKRDANPIIALTLAEWYYELEHYQKCQEVAHATLRGFTEDFKKAEKLLLRLLMFKTQALEMQGNVMGALEAAQIGLQDIINDQSTVRCIEDKIGELKSKIERKESSVDDSQQSSKVSMERLSQSRNFAFQPQEEEEEKQSFVMKQHQKMFNFQQFPDDVPRDRVDEAIKFRDLLQSMDTLVKPDSVWFIISKKWMNEWERYNYVDVLTGQKIQMTDQQRNAKPGKIDNEDILFVLPKGQYLLELANSFKWQNIVMKPNLKEGEHFILLDEVAWDYLKQRYEVKHDNEIKRMGIFANLKTEECLVELYLRQVLIFPLQNSFFKFDVPKTVLISRRDSLAGFEKKIQRLLMVRLYNIQERSLVVNKMRLWKICAAGRIEELSEIEKKVKNYTHVKFDGTCLNDKQQFEKANIFVEELPISQGLAEEKDLVVIELPNSKSQSFVLIPLNNSKNNS